MQRPRPLSVITSPEEKLRALCTLSDFGDRLDVTRFTNAIAKAPDPETAAEVVLDTFDIPTETLKRKWRSAVIELWSHQHPTVPLLPGLALASSDVVRSPFLRDVRSYLDELSEKPADLVKENDEVLVSPESVWRLAAALPSLNDQPPLQLENEWGCVPLRRIRQVVQALRLARVWKGQLVVVHSRLDRFLNLPLTQQYYILWHADAYHVSWGDFSGMWAPYLHIVQEYLQLLWELPGEIEAGDTMHRQNFIAEILDLYEPLWADEGLLETGTGPKAILPILQQHALPTILDTFLVRDLLVRHSFIEVGETFGTLSQLTWTKVGAAMIAAELEHDLPCGITILDK